MASNNSSGAVDDDANDVIISCDEQLLISETWVRAVLCVFYLAIFIIGLVGNILVVVVVGRNKSMRTTTNVYIVNLALSDVLMCLFAVPFTPIHSFMDEWIFGDVLCKLFPTSQVSRKKALKLSD